MRNIFKKILIVVLGLATVFLVAVAATAAREIWKSYKWKKSVAEWEESLRKPYKEDVYGGATPEETWRMFLDALRSGDIDLASKYFAVEKQKEWLEGLKKLKHENRLRMVIKDFETLRKSSEKSINSEKAYFYITTNTEEFGNISSSVVFYLNPYTKVWKILVL
jgi:hypothetical protein